MNEEAHSGESTEHERLKKSIKDEVLGNLDERARRLEQVGALRIVPDGVFAAPSTECGRLFRDGYYYGCISLIQAVIEAIVRRVWQVKFCKKKLKAGKFKSNLKSLRSKGFVSDDVKEKIERIWQDRDSFHHLDPHLEKDLRDLEQLAGEKLRLMSEVEQHFFAYDMDSGKIKPHHPEYWDLQPDGRVWVCLRNSGM